MAEMKARLRDSALKAMKSAANKLDGLLNSEVGPPRGRIVHNVQYVEQLLQC